MLTKVFFFLREASIHSAFKGRPFLAAWQTLLNEVALEHLGKTFEERMSKAEMEVLWLLQKVLVDIKDQSLPLDYTLEDYNAVSFLFDSLDSLSAFEVHLTILLSRWVDAGRPAKGWYHVHRHIRYDTNYDIIPLANFLCNILDGTKPGEDMLFPIETLAQLGQKHGMPLDTATNLLQLFVCITTDEVFRATNHSSEQLLSTKALSIDMPTYSQKVKKGNASMQSTHYSLLRLVARSGVDQLRKHQDQGSNGKPLKEQLVSLLLAGPHYIVNPHLKKKWMKRCEQARHRVHTNSSATVQPDENTMKTFYAVMKAYGTVRGYSKHEQLPYSWRGPDPERFLKSFQRKFDSVRSFETVNVLNFIQWICETVRFFEDIKEAWYDLLA